MADRRYDDKEIAAIFRAATEGSQSPQREVSREEGLTLADLQAIGREVGISPDAVAQAAQALDIRHGAASRTFLGLPIGVARTVNLGAARASIAAGFAVLAITATVAISGAVAGYLGDALPGIALLLATSIGMIASGALRLPRWARLRARQMDALAAQMANPPSSPQPRE
jgi:hypothetical protein